MKILCWLGIHNYKYTFISAGTYGLVDEDDDFCDEEGEHLYLCKCCGVKKKLDF